MSQQDLFGNTVPTQETKRQLRKRYRRENFNVNGTPRNNPMPFLYGETPGKKCKTCKHLVYFQYAHRYYKCELRSLSSSPTTDHRVNWPACKKYTEKE